MADALRVRVLIKQLSHLIIGEISTINIRVLVTHFLQEEFRLVIRRSFTAVRCYLHPINGLPPQTIGMQPWWLHLSYLWLYLQQAGNSQQVHHTAASFFS